MWVLHRTDDPYDDYEDDCAAPISAIPALIPALSNRLSANDYSRLEWPATPFWTPPFVAAWLRIVRSFEEDFDAA